MALYIYIYKTHTHTHTHTHIYMLPWWLISKEPACNPDGFDPWVRKIHWRRKWQPIPVFLPRESHGPKSLEGYSPWGLKRVGHNLATEHTHAHAVPNLYAVRGTLSGFVIWQHKMSSSRLISSQGECQDSARQDGLGIQGTV